MSMRRKLVSAYTPSNTSPEVLERIFVQREGILRRLVDRLSLALLGQKHYHALLIGPRGSGKTHLVTMAVHALEKRVELQDCVRIAWLGEDDTFTGLIDIALGMGDQLARRYPDEFPADFRKEVRGLTADDAAVAILSRILARTEAAHVLLVMENLNRAFQGLGDSGQKQLRAFLQNHGRITILGTSQQLFAGVENRELPFFGFFDITHLRPLTVEDAGALIQKIATEEGREELAKFVMTPEGRFRIRALHHLAGGNHRLYVQLSEFLSKDSLDHLVTAFEQIEEELTPYFQERLRSLAPQQARIVECLCRASSALSVKQIHEETFIAERNCSKQLSLLKKLGYVQGTSSGKETYYELCEPLLRLCLEVKHRRGAPLDLVVQFIRAWFPQDQLQSLRERAGLQSPLCNYLDRALVEDGALNKLLIESISLEVNQRLSAGELARAALLREELAFLVSKESGLVPDQADAGRDGSLKNPRLTSTLAKFTQGIEHTQAGRLDAAVADFSVVIDQHDTPPELLVCARLFRALVYEKQGDVTRAIADNTAVIEQRGAPLNLVNLARIDRGIRYGQQGDFARSIVDYTAVIEQLDAPPDMVAKARLNRGFRYGQQGDVARQIADYTAIIAQIDAPPDLLARARFNRGVCHGRQNDIAREIADYAALIEQNDAPPDLVARARFIRASHYFERDDITRAIADYTALIEQLNAPPDLLVEARLSRGLCYSQQNDVTREIADYTAVIEQIGTPPDPLARAHYYRALGYDLLNDVSRAIADYTAVIEQLDAPPKLIAMARIDRGFAFLDLGNYAASEADFRVVIEDCCTTEDEQNSARFDIVEPMVITSAASAVANALTEAFQRVPRASPAYGGTPADVVATLLRRGHQEWASYLQALVPVYLNYNFASELGAAAVRSAGVFDRGDYSPAQMDFWLAAWKAATGGNSQLSTSVEWLGLALEAIKGKSERPLLSIPLEIRTLVRPLLTHSLGSVA